MLLCDCGTHRMLTSALRVAGADEPLRISGTWDFKWPPGTKIRIAVQDLCPDANAFDLSIAIAQLRDALEAWIPQAAPKGGVLPNLSWVLLDVLLPPPAAPGDARSNPEELAANEFVDYDVLVSFAPLPVVIPETSQNKAQEVNFPRSELGTYAKRTEYGVPTLFLGPHKTFAGQTNREVDDYLGAVIKSLDPSVQKASESTALADLQPVLPGEESPSDADFDHLIAAWFDSAEGRFTLIHELGHVLGLAHEQQNPDLSEPLDWRPPAELEFIAKKRNAQNPPTGAIMDFVNSEIIDPWPGDRRFSDWREPPPVYDGHADFDSVMAKPVYRCFLNDHHRHDVIFGKPQGNQELDCKDFTVCPVEQSEFRRLSAPTASDLAQLVAMYGERSVKAKPADYLQSAE